MSDIFGYKRSPRPNGVFSSEDSKLVIVGKDVASMPWLIQNWAVQYQQDVQEIFELGSNRLYWVKNRPIGSAQFGRIVGGISKTGDIKENTLFPKDAFDICDGGATVEITATGGHCDKPPTKDDFMYYDPDVMNEGVKLKLSGVVVQSIGYSMSVNDFRIMENYATRFAYLSVERTKNSGGGGGGGTAAGGGGGGGGTAAGGGGGE